jgi:hypothetical protein
MMVPALVIGKGSSDEDEGCSDKINTTMMMVGLTVVVWCVERGNQYNFSRQMNNNSFCIKILIKASRCEVGVRTIYPAKPTSTHSYCFFPICVSRSMFGRKQFFVDVKLAGEIFIPPNLHLLTLIIFFQ